LRARTCWPAAISPVIDRTFTFDGIVDAYRDVPSRRMLGTVVVTLTDDATAPS